MLPLDRCKCFRADRAVGRTRRREIKLDRKQFEIVLVARPATQEPAYDNAAHLRVFFFGAVFPSEN